ncbi:MAG TPA: PHP domain-containing protein [Ktedonobacterales bacterium]
MPAITLRAGNHIDLHLHTTYSDGHWRPAELFEYLGAAKFSVVAVTDHDTIDHLDEMRALGVAHGVHVLGGVEVTTNWRGMVAHLLCYADRFTGDALERIVNQTRQGMEENTREVLRELERRGYRFPRRTEVLREQGGEALLPIDNARLLLEHGDATDLAQALEMIADAGYRIISAPLAEAVAAAHASGAVTILAHPGRGGGEIQQYEPPMVDAMQAEIPLDGIEAYYATHTPEQVVAYTTLAAVRGLMVSAGSDSHGPRHRYPIAYPAEYAARLLAHCGVEVVS